jgi:GDPmannose 4,6-dehydratase
MTRRALITGITGQDGAYLAKLLLEKQYHVTGLVRRASSHNTYRIDTLLREYPERLSLKYSDMTDSLSLMRVLAEAEPDEIYNLAAQSHVAVSFEMPEYTADADALGTLRILEAVRLLKLSARIYQASTSELFGNTPHIPQSETTPFMPCSPYATSKLYAYWITRNYRESYGMFASNGILFNHESPLRGEYFVTRKIAKAVAEYIANPHAILRIGNLDAKRDWGYAPDFVEGMWLILQHHEPDDFVLATGKAHTVREFIEKAFAIAGVALEWVGSGVEESGIDLKTGKKIVRVDPAYFRPHDVHYLCGDATKAKNVLGWHPRMTFDELVSCMVNAELASASFF